MILAAENYYSREANEAYMSVSHFKSFERCEAAAMAELRGEYVRPKTTALLVGSYVDSYFEGTLPVFKAQNPEIFKRDGSLKADYIKAETIIQRCESDPLFMEYMSGQKQVIKTAELFGTPWKIKIDSYLPGDKIVDLKCMRSIEPVMGVSFVEHWEYDLQMAVYSAVEGSSLETYLAVATKEDVPNLELIHIPKWRRDECLENVQKLLPHFLDVKAGKAEPERCGVCDYCKATKKLSGPIDYQEAGYSKKELDVMKGVY
ncbi:MAG TPA: hypothetical protein DG942_07925 [Ruminococcaceae bacterium]|nr:hypothetical protein [Oscillospiraceae bacterium]